MVDVGRSAPDRAIQATVAGQSNDGGGNRAWLALGESVAQLREHRLTWRVETSDFGERLAILLIHERRRCQRVEMVERAPCFCRVAIQRCDESQVASRPVIVTTRAIHVATQCR